MPRTHGTALFARGEHLDLVPLRVDERERAGRHGQLLGDEPWEVAALELEREEVV